jgi:hypothetical protein
MLSGAQRSRRTCGFLATADDTPEMKPGLLDKTEALSPLISVTHRPGRQTSARLSGDFVWT